MKRIGIGVEVSLWHFYGERRRWIYDFTDPDITDEAWSQGRVVAFVDAEGYYDGHDQWEPLPAGSWRKLPFRYFEHASDIPTGLFEIEPLAVAHGIEVAPEPTPPAQGAPGMHRGCDHDRAATHSPSTHPTHDVLFLRLVALTQFEKRPARKHDFRIEVYEPGEPIP